MEMKRGTVKSFDGGSYKATVQVAGSLPTFLTGVPVARNIPAAEMVAGRSCVLLFFGEGNPADAVLIAVYIA